MRARLVGALALGALACATGAPGGDAPRPAEGRVAYDMVASPVSGVEMPRIRLPDRPEIEQRVNARLDADAAELRCLDDVEDGWYETHPAVVYAADDVFSVEIRANFYCGGAHPMNDDDMSITFDLRTGKVVGFRSLFQHYDRHAAEIARAFVRNLPASEREGCEDVLVPEELTDHSFAYTVSPAGLRVRTSFPHVLEACNRTAVVPFRELRPFAAPGGLLMRLADAHARS